MKLPTAEEINPHKDLDGQWAEKNFSGKTIDEITELLKEDSLKYQEDFMWMGPKAFEFYLPAVFNYISSPFSEGDIDFISCMLGNFSFRLKNEGKNLKSALPVINNIVNYILNHTSHYFDPWEDENNWEKSDRNRLRKKCVRILENMKKLE